MISHCRIKPRRLQVRQTHVSKKLIGDLKMAKAILSWSFREACGNQFSFRPELHPHAGRVPRSEELTSIEQKIQSIKVWTTTSSAPPIPKAKYTPMYLPTSGFLPVALFISAHRFSQTFPAARVSNLKQNVELTAVLGILCMNKRKPQARSSQG